jgi:GH25 family lysozyme M1 (1,4-beta-N-acetylmuramidase)
MNFKKRRTIKNLIMLVIITALTLTYLPVTGAASVPAGAVEWNGRAALERGINYVITGSVRLASDLTIPDGVRIEVLRGGELLLGRDMRLILNGRLTVRIDAALELISGEIIIGNNGALNILGDFKQAEKTTLSIANGGNIEVQNRGNFTSAGSVNIFPDSELNNSGVINFYESAAVMVRGNINNRNNARVFVNNTVTVALSGNVTNYGSVTIESTGIIRNDGTVILHKDCEYIVEGSKINSSRSVFIDYRDDDNDVIPPRIPVGRELMTAAILENEPRVRIRGIDVSFWQGDIDWQRVAASGVQFAMIRAGRGSIDANRPMIEDTRFREYAEGALANGIDIGVYFYSYARNPADARREAQFLVNIIKDFEITYPVVFDIEDEIHERLSRRQVTAIVEAFFEVLMDNNYFPMIYSFRNFLEEKIEPRVLDTYAVWVAHWYVDRTNYRYPYHMWQYTDRGRIPGIRGDVDRNISYYDFAEILRRHGLNNLT